jgi:hypothetical protein
VNSFGKHVLLALAVAAFVPGCAAPGDDNTDTSGADHSPTTQTSPRVDGTGAPILGTARTTLNGCFLMGGDSFLNQAFQFLKNPAHYSSIVADDGTPFLGTVHAVPTTQTTNFTQDIDITLGLGFLFHPSGRLRVTLVQQAPNLIVSIVNTTPIVDSQGATNTVIKTGDFALNVRLTAQSNGLTMVGTADVALQQEQQQANPTSMFVRHFFDWLSADLTALPPVSPPSSNPSTPPPAPAP